MSLRPLAQLVNLAVAITAGLGYFSFWWVLLSAFVASALTLTDDRHHFIIIQANEEGRLYVFPSMLLAGMIVPMAVAGLAFWITRAVGGPP